MLSRIAALVLARLANVDLAPLRVRLWAIKLAIRFAWSDTPFARGDTPLGVATMDRILRAERGK